MYFENVGGIHFEAALEILAKYGRVAVCGAIESYC
jgi:NADPH-dependent curcumin reductase CurA